MTLMEVAIFTSKVYLILGLVALAIFLVATLICVFRKKDYSGYFGLMVFSAIIVIMAKFNLFVPFV